MTTTCKSLSSNVRHAHLHEAPAVSLPCVTDFVSERDRLRKETDEAIKWFEIEKEIRKAAAQRRRSIELYDPLEDWLYSLIPAAAIVALLVGVLGLLDSRTPTTQTTGAGQPSMTERALPSQAKDGKF